MSTSLQQYKTILVRCHTYSDARTLTKQIYDAMKVINDSTTKIGCVVKCYVGEVMHKCSIVPDDAKYNDVPDLILYGLELSKDGSMYEQEQPTSLEKVVEAETEESPTKKQKIEETINYEDELDLLDSIEEFTPPKSPLSPIKYTSYIRNEIPTKVLETLSDAQRKAVRLVGEGKNVVIIGSSGVGKSHVSKLIINCFNPNDIAVAASTGAAACLIGGSTIHSLFGIGLGEDPAPKLLAMARSKPDVMKVLRTIRVLLIDEISLLSSQLLEKIEYIARKVKKNEHFFGGIQTILVGDLAQCQPISKRNEERQRYVFESASWFDWFPIEQHVTLTVVFRQKDKFFKEVLVDLRDGKYTNKVRNFVKTVQRPLPIVDGIEATHLSALKKSVEDVNITRLNQLPGQLYEILAEDQFYCGPPTDQRIKALNNCSQALSELKIKEGAQVILIKNMSVASGLANGSRGVVTKIYICPKDKTVNTIFVRFLNGVTKGISREKFEMKSVGRTVLAVRMQFPLVLGYATTIHKAQVLTYIFFCKFKYNSIQSFACV
jgi:hypothetical protein